MLSGWRRLERYVEQKRDAARHVRQSLSRGRDGAGCMAGCRRGQKPSKVDLESRKLSDFAGQRLAENVIVSQDLGIACATLMAIDGDTVRNCPESEERCVGRNLRPPGLGNPFQSRFDAPEIYGKPECAVEARLGLLIYVSEMRRLQFEDRQTRTHSLTTQGAKRGHC